MRRNDRPIQNNAYNQKPSCKMNSSMFPGTIKRTNADFAITALNMVTAY